MSRTRIADDPDSWVIPDDLKEAKKPILPANPTDVCPGCGTMWMYHSGNSCSEIPASFWGDLLVVDDVNEVTVSAKSRADVLKWFEQIQEFNQEHFSSVE